MMRSVVVGVSLILALTASAAGQSLAHCLPADTLVFVRQAQPLQALDKVSSSGLLWDDPVDIHSGFLQQMDEGLGQADEFLGIPVGSLTTYLRSIQLFEGALCRLELTDGFPEVEFVVMIQTPQADAIYKILSGKLIEEQLGEEIAQGELEVTVGDMFGMNIAQREDKLVLASDQRKLREVMSSFGSVVDGCLAQSPRFQAAVGGPLPDQCLYGKVDFFLEMLREEGSRAFSGRDGQVFRRVAESLGLWKLAALAFVEGENASRFAVLGSEAVPAFDILASPGGNPDLLGMMPAETVFGATWCGDTINLWKKASAFLLDSARFPMAGRVEEALRGFQQMSGLKIEEVANIVSGGLAFGFIPDADGRLDDNPENFILAFRTPDPERTREMTSKLLAVMTEGRGMEVVSREDGGIIWYEVKNPQARRAMPLLALAGDLGVVAVEAVTRRFLEAKSGQYPSLSSVNALRGVRQGAAVYMYLGMKGILGQENEFAPAYARMKDGAGVAAALEIAKDRLVLTTNQPLGRVLSAFAVAGAMYEGKSEQRRVALQDLEKIAKAYREYRGQHGKDPATLADLGFTGEKALAFPPGLPQGQQGKPYVLVSAGAAGSDNEWRTIVAYAPDTSLGRLVATLDGQARSWSESRFRRDLNRQKNP